MATDFSKSRWSFTYTLAQQAPPTFQGSNINHVAIFTRASQLSIRIRVQVVPFGVLSETVLYSPTTANRQSLLRRRAPLLSPMRKAEEHAQDYHPIDGEEATPPKQFNWDNWDAHIREEGQGKADYDAVKETKNKLRYWEKEYVKAWPWPLSRKRVDYVTLLNSNTSDDRLRKTIHASYPLAKSRNVFDKSKARLTVLLRLSSILIIFYDSKRSLRGGLRI